MSTSSTGRRSGPPTATPPTGCGWLGAPTPRPRRTKASPCCWCRPPTPATPARSSAPSPPTTPPRATTRTSASPSPRRVGAENEGWRLITNQLNHERVTLAAHGTMAIRALHDVQRWARETGLADGRRVADLPWVRRLLARTHTRLDALALLNRQMVSAVEDGTLTPQDASAVKVYGSEARRDAYAWLMESRRRRRPAEGGLGGRRPARRTGARLPLRGHLHLRRRQQRDPARDHLLDRPGHAPGAPLTAGRRLATETAAAPRRHLVPAPCRPVAVTSAARARRPVARGGDARRRGRPRGPAARGGGRSRGRGSRRPSMARRRRPARAGRGSVQESSLPGGAGAWATAAMRWWPRGLARRRSVLHSRGSVTTAWRRSRRRRHRAGARPRGRGG